MKYLFFRTYSLTLSSIGGPRRSIRFLGLSSEGDILEISPYCLVLKNPFLLNLSINHAEKHDLLNFCLTRQEELSEKKSS